MLFRGSSRDMELTELSLAPKLSCSSHEIKSCSNNSSSSSSDHHHHHHHHGHNSFTKKRKFFPDQLLKSPPPSKTHTSLVDLQVSDPLPQDWEQFLDLQVTADIHFFFFFFLKYHLVPYLSHFLTFCPYNAVVLINLIQVF